MMLVFTSLRDKVNNLIHNDRGPLGQLCHKIENLTFYVRSNSKVCSTLHL